MARKRLIKGANAARVEERIARVPADVALPEAPPEANIFGALRALEGGSPAPLKAAVQAPTPPAGRGRVGPSDFSAAEREEIVRCCSDYRNRLPTYLLAVQKEVEVLDSVIEKCRAQGGRSKKA